MKVIQNLSIIIFFILAFGSCKNSKTITDSNTNNVSQKNEIITTLKGTVSPRQVLGAYQMYKLTIVKEIDPDKNIWLFSFDPTLIKPEEMLKHLKYSQFTTTAKFKDE